jgi:hypothetical protein
MEHHQFLMEKSPVLNGISPVFNGPVFNGTITSF